MCSSPSVAKPIVGYFETEKQTKRTRQGSVLHSRGTCRDTYYTFFTFKDYSRMIHQKWIKVLTTGSFFHPLFILNLGRSLFMNGSFTLFTFSDSSKLIIKSEKCKRDFCFLAGPARDLSAIKMSRPALGPTQPPTLWVEWGIWAVVNRPVWEADHLPHSMRKLEWVEL